MNSEQLLSLILDYINKSTKIENIEVIDISKKIGTWEFSSVNEFLFSCLKNEPK